MASKTEIANMALGSIGISSPIANFDEQSAEARAIRRFYSVALQSVLESAHWNFARAQMTLTLLADATAGQTVPWPWTYKYAYPPDSCQIRYVMPAAGAGGTPSVNAGVRPVRFVVGVDVDASGNESKVVLCNEPSAIAVYTRAIQNEAMFDSQFVMTLAAYLGHLVCMPLQNDIARSKAAYERANNASIVAQASNGDEGLSVIDTMPDWLRARDVDYNPEGMRGISAYVNGPTALVPVT